jgi:hypothetical protein
MPLQLIGDFASQVTLQIGSRGLVLARVARIHFVGQPPIERRQPEQGLLQPGL